MTFKNLEEENKRLMIFIKTILLIPLSIAVAMIIGIIVDLAFAIFLKFAWNRVMPQIFNLSTITFFQAFLLLSVLTMLWKITPISIQNKK